MNKERVKIFIDTEFTGLYKDCDLISIGMVAEDGREFYAETDEYIHISDWVLDNVVPHLKFGDVKDKLAKVSFLSDDIVEVKLKKEYLAVIIHEWLETFGPVEIWSDVLAYDWTLFCNLFEQHMTEIFEEDGREVDEHVPDLMVQLPENVYYIPFDIATLMRLKGVDPDISREDFAKIPQGERIKHNALFDAKVIKICYNRLMEM